MCISVSGVLKLSQHEFAERFRDGVCTNSDTGKAMTVSEVRAYFMQAHFLGRKVVPMGQCDNFDYEHGCKGHEVSEA
jgi:hypothetical protein